MSATYIAENGVTKKIKKLYDVENGLTKKIKKLYKVENGITNKIFEEMEVIGYTGDYTVTDVMVGTAPYKLYTLTSSGTLTLGEDAEYWMCAGGNAGANGVKPEKYQNYNPGDGGGGGNIMSGILSAGTHTVTIGAGASSSKGKGGATSIGSISIANSSYKNGASGGGAAMQRDNNRAPEPTYYTVGKGANKSTIPFDGRITSGFANRKHSPGGGGGMHQYTLKSDGTPSTTTKGGTGGSNGGDGGIPSVSNTIHTVTSASGGSYGGGKGGALGNGGDGSFYGAGSGGGSSYYSNYNSSLTKGYSCGKAYQGVAYLLIPA